ncbi:MAG: transposase [Actinobacteria bacterium]|nr:transposase [Actinomycetota bacterium]
MTVDERGTSSSCPDCGRRVPKPSGRILTCPHCGQPAARGGGIIRAPVRIEHRRAGTLHGVTDADTCTMSAVGLARLRAAHP